MSRWDKEIDFYAMYSKILRHMRRAGKLQSCYDSILLVQLRNGSRISEAVRAYQAYLKTKSTEVKINVSKKKKPEQRLMIIPREVKECVELLDIPEKTLRDRLKVYALKAYRVNTHSLRYAFITHLLKEGINPSIIAKITRHSKLDHILTYTQEKAAEDILRAL